MDERAASDQTKDNGDGTSQRRRPAPSRREAGGMVELGLLHAHLGYFLRRAQVAVFQDFIGTLEEIEIRPAQYSVLAVIAANRDPSQSDVAQTLGIERARLVRLLDRLERRGLLKRYASARDRRSHALRLTPEGQRMLKRAQELALLHEERLITRLGQDKHRLMLEALRKFSF